MRTAYEKNKELAAVFAGPACQEVFGGKPFAPVDKESACHLSERQQKLALEYQNDLAQLRNRYINGEETGFTVLCFPTPEVGEKFPEIFREIIRINTLDYKKYQTIQQTIIDTLDQGVKVHVLGRGANHTDITVALHELKVLQRRRSLKTAWRIVTFPWERSLLHRSLREPMVCWK